MICILFHSCSSSFTRRNFKVGIIKDAHLTIQHTQNLYFPEIDKF
jgi:hypothetical protein